MISKIIMGNDELILYIRKKTAICNLKNDHLGRLIWEWVRDRGAIKTEEDKPCHWGGSTKNTDDFGLPKTAAQFEFDRILLPELYNYLDELSIQ